MSEPAHVTDPILEGIPGFEIEREIARGGMATVYLANQLSLDRKVALKILGNFAETDRARFIKESRIIGSINHRSVITIHDVGVEGDCAFLAMEYLQGGDLASKLEGSKLQVCEALEIAAAIADCLDSVHQQGIVHRDVKPANVLFHSDETPVLTDFGIATDVRMDERLTACGATIGSPCYVSPEQATGAGTDNRTDIYSLGVVLYEMLTGRLPFKEDSAVETMAARLSLPPPLLPENLSACQPLLDRMLAKDRSMRFSQAGDAAEAMRDLQLRLPSVNSGSASHTTEQLLESARVYLGTLRPKVDNFRVWLLKSPRVVAGALLIAMLPGIVSFVDWITEPREVTRNLDQAQVALDDDRLSRPRSDSAVFYYRKVLSLDPGNGDAEDGLHEIAEVYADRAEDDIESREFLLAKQNVDRGLRAEVDNERLLELQEDTKSLRSLPEKMVRGIRSIFD